MLYRAMKADEDGSPAEERSARGLGVRVYAEDGEWDLPVNEGRVQPNTGGMSVAVDDPRELPPWRRPRSLGGTGSDAVFELNESHLPERLVLRRTSRRGHGLVEPREDMPIEEYEALLGETKPRWRPIL